MAGKRPHSLGDALLRAQNTVFAAQARHAVMALQTEHRLRASAESTSGPPAADPASSVGLPPRDSRDAEASLALLHMVYSQDEHETAAKTFEYSEASVNFRCAAGYRDMQLALDHYRSAQAIEERQAFQAYRLQGGEITSYDG